MFGCLRASFMFHVIAILRQLRDSLLAHEAVLNRLTPNDPYMGPTAPLTSKRCILYIY